MKNSILLFLLCIIFITYLVLDSVSSSSQIEQFKCVRSYVGYNNYCDIAQCTNVCEPGLQCNEMTNKCGYNEPQPNDYSCTQDKECMSGYCLLNPNGMGMCASKTGDEVIVVNKMNRLR